MPREGGAENEVEEKERAGGAVGVGVGGGKGAPGEGVELARLQQQHHIARRNQDE